MRFFLNKKTGFLSPDPLVIISDSSGRIFYLKENTEGVQHFNLPEGEYTSNNNLQQTTPREYEYRRIPKPYNPIPFPDHFKIVFCTNPNKCSVDLNTNTVFFDYEFQSYPLYILYFIIYHELGHYLYRGEGNKSERYCDLFADNFMLMKGYNPTQIAHAQKFTLSNSQKAQERKRDVYTHLKSLK